MAYVRRPRATRPRKAIYGRKKRAMRKMAIKRSPGQGYLYAKRKSPMIVIRSLGIAGAFDVQDEGLGTQVTLGTPVAATGLPAGWYDLPFSMTFAFNQIANQAEFVNLFDAYKIHKAIVRISPNGTIAQSATSQTLPYIEWLNDHDDAAAPTVTQFRERMGVRTKFFSGTSNSTTLVVQPKVAFPVYNALGGNSFAIPYRPTWLNMANTSVPHYAIKGVIRHVYSPGVLSQTQITVDTTLCFGVKGVQ